MVIELVVMGRTDSSEVETLVVEFQKRVNRYVKFGIVTLSDARSAKGGSEEGIRRAEAALILKYVQAGDHLVLLDERGGQHTSKEFALWMQKKMNAGTRKLVFLIGGPYGFDKAVYDRANEALSLSKMTFSHQIIRPIFCEQLYRAFTILNNEPYHHG